MSVLSEISRRLPDSVVQFTTDPATRTGILQAAWSVAPSYARGFLPRSPLQQAGVVGANAITHYAIGATAWSGISSIVAGAPGHRAGWRALLAGSVVAGGGGLAVERILRAKSGDNYTYAAAWSGAKLLSTTGLAGGLVTVTDVIAHKALGRPPSIATTLLLDVTAGAGMAAGSFVRRNRRARAHTLVEPDRPVVKSGNTVKDYATIAGITVVTISGIAGVATAEQTAARAINTGLTNLAGTDLGDTGVLLSHSATASVLGVAGWLALRQARNATRLDNERLEGMYEQPPSSSRVSCGPNSLVSFDSIGKEGRRFVLMTLTAPQITNVMGETAIDPVRAVIPRDGRVADRAQLAVDELEALGGFERSVILVASPTGVGYVNYIMAEALEYLTRGDCAIVVPQYALVPSALALDQTRDGTELQTQVLDRINQRLARIPAVRRPRMFQFGESLGAQVALDVAEKGKGGIRHLDRLGVRAGIYLGVPFRSQVWRVWWDHKEQDDIDPDHRLVSVTQPSEAPDRSGMHLMVIHNDDPVNKFAYTMFFRRPWWFGPPQTRPPMMPRETLFRPVSSLLIAGMDMLNAMDQRPGEFFRVGHDYRIDLREALQKAFELSASPSQADAIEAALRQREQTWAATRMIYKNTTRAMQSIQKTLNRWGQSTVSLDLVDDDSLPLPPAVREAMARLTARD